MAPEQIGQSNDVGIRTDVYGLGGLLYFILTHLSPVDASSSNELIEKTKKD